MFTLENVKYQDILNIEYLEIKEKEITCVVGQSGGGKTTFLRLLNNMISPTKGQIKFRGKELTDYDPINLRREILMLPQNPVVFPGTIRKNFQLAQKYAGQNQEEKNYNQILDKVALGDFSLDDSVENFSGGEQQRLALARVLLLKPQILLLDEPSSALDEETEDFIIQMVVDYIKQQQGTLIMITHSLEIAQKYGSTIVTITNGEIENVR
ncbi:MAG: ABC transporter ATP-binding protein [bacterium]